MDLPLLLFLLPGVVIGLKLLKSVSCGCYDWNAQYACVRTSFLLLSVHLYFMKLDANENVNFLFELLSTTAKNVAENMKQTSVIRFRSHVMFQVDP
jgi:hypothetical protein